MARRNRNDDDTIIPSHWWYMFNARPAATPLSCVLILAAVLLYLVPVTAWLPPATLAPRLGEERFLFDSNGFRYALLWQFITAPLLAENWHSFVFLLLTCFVLRYVEFHLSAARVLALLWCSQAMVVLVAQAEFWPRSIAGAVLWQVWWLASGIAAVEVSRPNGRRRRLIGHARVMLALLALFVTYVAVGKTPMLLATFDLVCLLLLFALGYLFGATYNYRRLNRSQVMELPRLLVRYAKRQAAQANDRSNSS